VLKRHLVPKPQRLEQYSASIFNVENEINNVGKQSRLYESID
jgi:hypothetical protein